MTEETMRGEEGLGAMLLRVAHDTPGRDERLVALAIVIAGLAVFPLLPSWPLRLAVLLGDALVASAFAWGLSAGLAGIAAATMVSGGAHLVPTLAGREVTSWLLIPFAALAVAARLRQRALHARLTPVEVALAVMAVAAVVSSAVLFLLGTSAIGGMLRMLLSGVIVVAIASLPPTERALRRITFALLGGLTVQALVGLAEEVAGRTFFFRQFDGTFAKWGPFVRVASTAADPNYLAIGLVAALPLLLIARKLLPRGRWVVFPLGAVWFSAAALTFSRAGFLALGIYGLVLLRKLSRPNRMKVYAGLAVLAVVTAAAAPSVLVAVGQRLTSFLAWQTDASLQLRFQGQAAALRAFAHNPLLGVGYDRFMAVSLQYLANKKYVVTAGVLALNSFLTVAAEGGLVALLAFCGAFASALSASFRAAREDAWPLAWPLGISLVLFAVMSLTLDGLHMPMQWLLFGMAALLYRRAGAARSDALSAETREATTAGATMADKVSVLVVSFNTREVTAECVRRARASEGVDVDVIVVDNASSDGSPDALAPLLEPGKLVANTANAGFGRANDQAWELAEGRYVLLLNNDCFVEPDTIATCVKELEELGAAAVACQLRNADGTVQPSVRRLPSVSSELIRSIVPPGLLRRVPVLGAQFMAGWDHRGVRRVDQPAGAFLLMRQGAWGAGAPFDERFFMFYDDVDLCRRILEGSGSIWFTDHAAARHLGESSTSTARVAMAEAIITSRYRYFLKWHGRTAALAVTVANMAGNLARAATWSLLGLASRDERRAERTAANVAAAREGLRALREAA